MKKFIKIYIENLLYISKSLSKAFILIIIFISPVLIPLILILQKANKYHQIIPLKAIILWLLWVFLYGILLGNGLDSFNKYKQEKNVKVD